MYSYLIATKLSMKSLWKMNEHGKHEQVQLHAKLYLVKSKYKVQLLSVTKSC